MKETKLFQLVTGIEMKPWLAQNMLTQFPWSNLSIYFNFLCAVPRDDIIESTRFLMRPPVIIPPWYSPYLPLADFRDQHSFRYTVLIHSLHVSKPSQLLYSPTPSLFSPALLCTSSLLTNPFVTLSLFRLARKKYPPVWLSEMWNSYTSVFPNTCVWE